ncbi:MAG: N-acetylneuraminate synthase [Candidatus Omnitrophota bacterium]
MNRMNSVFKFKETFIIAEAGVNHNGDIALAKELIDAARESGADAVKFQNFKAERTISRYAIKAGYQKNSKGDRETQLAMLKKLELRDEDYFCLFEYAGRKKILFLSTPKDIPGARLLQEMGIAAYKIGSSEINNFEFLKFIASLSRPVILSTGMSTLSEVRQAVEVIRAESDSPLALLHCVSQYPCPVNKVNLRAMLVLEKAFHTPVGYSDHTLGIEVALAAVALGAKIIEKHFTLDKGMKGPDHKISATPEEFKEMVSFIRNVEKSLGCMEKSPSPCEIKNRRLLRRGLVFAKDLTKGCLISYEDITIKRPATGLEPKHKERLIGKKLKKDVKQDEPVKMEMFLV